MIIDLENDNEELMNNLELAFPNSFLKQKIKEDLNKNIFSKYFIYMQRSNIIGFVNYYDLYDRFEISYIEVKSEYRNNHIGSLMMDHLIDIGNQKDLNLIVVDAESKFNTVNKSL